MVIFHIFFFELKSQNLFWVGSKKIFHGPVADYEPYVLVTNIIEIWVSQLISLQIKTYLSTFEITNIIIKLM